MFVGKCRIYIHGQATPRAGKIVEEDVQRRWIRFTPDDYTVPTLFINLDYVSGIEMDSNPPMSEVMGQWIERHANFLGKTGASLHPMTGVKAKDGYSWYWSAGDNKE